jgi:deoxyribodipyrimidine photo-lyase
MYGLRKTPQARAEADAVQSRHGSRKSGMAQTGVRRRTPVGDKVAAAGGADAQQADLFADFADPAGAPDSNTP